MHEKASAVSDRFLPALHFARLSGEMPVPANLQRIRNPSNPKIRGDKGYISCPAAHFALPSFLQRRYL